MSGSRTLAALLVMTIALIAVAASAGAPMMWP